ncbi:MAG TPA: putative metal-dependent hydrolase [Gemmatimonadaceae bacterium]|nr:putative metal-dependent hydrolase [Gemmatimonadaceae bacterium]
MSTTSDLESLRFPVGRLARKPVLTPSERAALIETIAAFPARLRAAVERLDDAALDTPYRPAGWTRRQVVHHVADSHMNAYVRVQLGLTEDAPTIKPYDEKAWAELPYARSAPVATSLALVEALHARWSAQLRDIGEAQWSRRIVHPENGPMTLDDVLQVYAWHCRHHLGHVGE